MSVPESADIVAHDPATGLVLVMDMKGLIPVVTRPAYVAPTASAAGADPLATVASRLPSHAVAVDPFRAVSA